MRNALQRPARLGRLLTSAMLGAMALGACSDQLAPVAPTDQQLTQPSTALQAFDCVASVTDGVRCSPAGSAGRGASRIIIGGQNEYLRLSSSNASYNAGTEVFSVDVTLQNLMNEAMGTPDGTTPDPAGINVFFTTEPFATSGTGEVSVANEDGAGFFTDANQEYHTYTGILEKDEVSSSKTWEFNMEPTVTSFRFTVLISATVQYLLVINEVGVNPGGTILDANGEYFEVINLGSLPVDMEDLVIADSAASGRRPYHSIGSSLVVNPGAYVVLGNTTNTTNNGGVPVNYAYGSALQLANSLDAVKIARVVGTDTLTLDRTQYSSPGVSAQNGIARELTNPSLDNSNMDGSNWADALVTAVFGPWGRGTPGAQNSSFVP